MNPMPQAAPAHLLWLLLMLLPLLGNAQNPAMATHVHVADSIANQSGYPDAAAYLAKHYQPAYQSDTLYTQYINGMGLGYLQSFQLNKADSLLHMALSIEQSQPQPRAYALSNIYSNLGDLYRYKGNADSNLYANQLALQFSAQAYGNQSEHYATRLNNLSISYQMQNQLPKAIAMMDSCLSVLTAIGLDTGQQAIMSMANLVSFYSKVQDYEKGEQLGKKALNLINKHKHTETPLYPLTTNNLADVYQQMGDYINAEKYYQRTLEADRKQSGEMHPNYANTLSNLGNLYLARGVYDAALHYLNKSLHIKTNVYGDNTLQIIIPTGVLGSVYSKKLMPDSAEKYLKKSVKLREQMLPANHPATAMGYNNLAYHYGDINADSAIKYIKMAMEIRKANYGDSAFSYTMAMVNYSFYLKSKGQYQKAAALYPKILSNFDRYPTAWYTNERAGVYENYAVLQWAMQNNKTARKYFIKSLDTHKENLTQNSPHLSETEREALYNEASDAMMFLFQYFTENPRKSKISTERLYNTLLFFRAALLTYSNRLRQTINSSSQPELKKLFKQLENNREQIGNAQNQTTGNTDKDNRFIDSLNREAINIEKQLIQKSDFARQSFAEFAITWKDVRNKLKKDEAAVEILAVDGYHKDSVGHIVPNQLAYIALIIDGPKARKPTYVILPNGTEMNNKYFSYYRNKIMHFQEDKLSYKVFWEPIRKKIKKAKTIYITNDGVYNKININTLLNPKTGQPVLDETFIRPLTSSKEIALGLAQYQVPARPKALLVGMPDFGANMLRQSKQRGATPQTDTLTTPSPYALNRTLSAAIDANALAPLPGTQQEINNISELLRVKNFEIYNYTGKAASEKAIKQVAQPYLLHLATHGYFLAGGTIGNTTQSMLQSGLLLSGAGPSLANPEQVTDPATDGILTALEVSNLTFNQMHLAVLSACETGLGNTLNTDGVYGLQRAFKVAGCRHIIMSLWKVDDNATAELMRLFYQYWQQNNMAPKALNMAQKQMQQAGYTPYQWGGFVLLGY